LSALALVLPLKILWAQNSVAPVATPSATLTHTADKVDIAGYLLKPTGLATNEWPNLRIDFSIERADHTIFKNLTLADVAVKLDGALLPATAADLEQKESQSSGVMVLLDGSGSMRGAGIDKLRAAQQSLKTLVDKLDANQSVGLIAFDEEPRLIVSPTTDKEKVKQEIDRFTIREKQSRFTRLYEAVAFGLEQAKANHIQNLLVISDGWEDTPETRNLSAAQLESFKHDHEQKLIDESRSKGIRVFTIAIGNEHGAGLTYVDRATLDNISKGANGGSAAYIELRPELGEKALQESFLLSHLQQTLDDLRQSFRYTYSLTLRVNGATQHSGDEHKLWAGFTVGNEPRVQLPIEYTYALPAEGVPIVKSVNVQPAIFIQSAPRTVTWQQLLFIYLLLLLALAVLAFVPGALNVLLRGSASLRLHKSILTIEHGSPLIGTPCPNEGTASGRLYLIKEGDVVVVCPNRSCRTAHHLSCWAFSDHRCMQRNCETVMVIPDTVLEKYGLLEGAIGEEHSWITS
jgi:Mg-chelatase subunit ChlD